MAPAGRSPTSRKRYDIIITHTALNMNNEKTQKKVLTLSKKLISNLPVFMDTAVETLVSFTGLKAEKVAHTIKSFDSKIDNDNICLFSLSTCSYSKLSIFISIITRKSKSIICIYFI